MELPYEYLTLRFAAKGKLTMNKIIVVMVALAALCFSATQADASLQVGSVVKFDTTPPGTYGGQFRITDPGNPAGYGFSPFITFCVELTEQVANNGVYTVTGISDTTVAGGRTLTNYAAWLYTQFTRGTLNAFDYASTSASNALQYVFWQEMGYSNSDINNALPGSPAASYAANVPAAWENQYDSDILNNLWNGAAGYLGSVRVMNLVTASGGRAQDQLVMVPEASTIAVWSVLSLLGAGVAYRKRTR